MKLRIKEILEQKEKTKYWLYIQLGLSYQNFNKIINNQTSSIKFENLKAICDILECTPNDLFEEYYKKQFYIKKSVARQQRFFPLFVKIISFLVRNVCARVRVPYDHQLRRRNYHKTT